jgi:pimeloyl-ACP methyl ester carboxylesterase
MSPEDDGASTMLAVRRALGEWTQPVQVLFSTGDPTFSTRMGEQLAELIPGASMLETVEDAGHFLQEDRPHEVGRRIAAFLQESK